MTTWEVIKTWDQSPAKHVAGIRYTDPSTEGWVEIGNNVKIGNYVKIGDYATIGNNVKIGNYVKIGDGAAIGNYVKIENDVLIENHVTIGESVKIGNYATIGNDGMIRNHATIGNYVKIGDHATIGNHADISKSPLYIRPSGGTWPVCVSDPDKKMVSIGCESHPIDWWLDGGLNAICKKHHVEEAKDIYVPVLKFVAKHLEVVKQ